MVFVKGKGGSENRGGINGDGEVVVFWEGKVMCVIFFGCFYFWWFWFVLDQLF